MAYRAGRFRLTEEWAPAMRFHAKFQTPFALSSIMLIVVCYAWMHKVTASSNLRHAYFVLGILSFLQLVSTLLSYRFIYWDLTSEALYERRWSKIKRITYDEIKSVSPWSSNKPTALYIEIEYGDGKPGSTLDPPQHIIANPSDRDAFIEALRKHALRAEFSL